MKELKKIDIISLAKFEALFMAILSFVSAIIYTMIGNNMSSQMSEYNIYTTGYMGVISIIVSPIVYGILGFIFGMLLAIIYNILAKKIGGIKIEIK